MTEEEKKLLELQQAQAATPIEQPTTEEAPEVSTPAAPQQQSGAMLDDIFRQYEQRKKNDAEADKRDRRLKILNSVGDVAHALSNLYFTTQYAPNSYKGGNAEKSQAAYDKAKSNRDKETDSWMRYMLNYAGKKQADEAAEEAAKRQQERLDKAQKAADDKEKNAKEKARAAQMKGLRKDINQHYYALLLNDEFGKEDEEALTTLWDTQLKSGALEQDEYDAMMSGLKDAQDTYGVYIGKKKTSQQYKSSNGGGKGGGNNFQYIGFADGSGVNINKNDKDAIGGMYGRLPSSAKLTKKDKFGRDVIDDSPESSKALRAVLLYLSSHRDEEIEKYARQVSKRHQQPTQQQSNGKYSNVNKKGTKTDYTHVNKR